jgi:hypothetical protein
MLDIMEKKYTVSDIKKAVFMCFDHGLYSAPVGYMLGMPGESLEICDRFFCYQLSFFNFLF